MDVQQPMSRILHWALTDLILSHPEIVMMGEYIGRKGGVCGITQRLWARFGNDLMIDTILDEQSILGLAFGMARNGFITLPKIQFLACLHNAEDQIRGEAATLPFFSNGQYANPMVLRIAGLGFQKAFDGHFHNDNSVAVLRDVPGLVLAILSTGAVGDGSDLAIWRSGDLAIVTYGTGKYLSNQVQPALRDAGIHSRIIDLRWLSPLPVESLFAAP